MQKELNTQVKKVQDGVVDTAHKIWLAGLGAASIAEERGSELFVKVEKETTRFFDELISRGRELETAGRTKVEKITNMTSTAVEDIQSDLDVRVEKVVRRLGVPHRHQISKLADRVEELTKKVEAFQAEAGIEAAIADKAVVLLLPAEGGGWLLKKDGAEAILSEHATKDEALAAGRKIAQKLGQADLVVHKLDGTVQATYEYGVN